MSTIQEWAEDKPLLIALAAPWVASLAPNVHIAFEQLNSWSIQSHKLPGTDRLNWYKLYRSHRSTFGVLYTIFSQVYGKNVTEIGYQVYLFSIRRSQWKKVTGYRPSPKEQNFVGRILRRLLLASFTLLQNTLLNKPVNQKAKDEILNQVKTNIEFAFFIKVTAPCWIFYGMPPVNLYRRALQGNYEAIEKLLRLDSLMIHEPKISENISKYRFGSSSNAYEQLLAAPNRVIDVPKNLKNIKYSIGGLISALSQIIGRPLTAPQIRSLFNAIVKESDPIEYNNEKPEDLDFPENDDSFYRRIKEKHDFWLKMLHPDKTKFSNVRVRESLR